MKVSVCGKVLHRKQDNFDIHRHGDRLWTEVIRAVCSRCSARYSCLWAAHEVIFLCSHDLRSNTRPPSKFLPLRSHTFNVLSLADNLYLLGIFLVPLQLHTLIRTPARRWRRELEGGRGWREKKGMDGSCLTTKELGCTGGFFSIRPVCGPWIQYSFSLMYSWAWNFNVICGRIQMASSRINAAHWQCRCQRPGAQ